MQALSATDGAALEGARDVSGQASRSVLLPAKLTPPGLAHATVRRPRLLARLSRAVQQSSLTLLSGPAGSGKTSLAASWRVSEEANLPIAWLGLDEYDDDPAVFWSYVVEALQGVGVPLTGVAPLDPGEPLPSRFVTGLAAALGRAPRPVVLIIDNSDHVTHRAITAGLDLLVRHAGDHLRLVLCARADPLLPLHQYRLAGAMSEIRGDELAFTPEETHDLLAALRVPVSPDVAARLCARTQGWAVGLRLAAAPLKQGTSPEQLVSSLAHDDGSVAQYLFAEVLAGQPASVRRVLLRTSVTPDLSPELVDRLTGRPNSTRVLAALARANAFVEESTLTPGVFRIHPLFREMLQGQLAYEHPGEAAELHRVCARWYAERVRPGEAVEHAVAAADWALATHLLIDDLLVARLLAHGSDLRLRGLAAMPRNLGTAEAGVIRAAVALAAGQAPTAGDLSLARAATAGGDRPALRASAALTCLTAAVASGADRAEALALAGTARALVDTLPGEDRREHREFTALVAAAEAVVVLRAEGPTDDVVTRFRAAATAAQAARTRRLRTRAVADLALVEALEGRLTRAARLVSEAEAISGGTGDSDGEGAAAAAVAAAWVHTQRYELDAAREWSVRALARIEQPPVPPEGPLVRALLDVVQGRQLRLRREHQAAAAQLEPLRRDPALPPWLRRYAVIEALRLALARDGADLPSALLEDPVLDAADRDRARVLASLLDGGATALPLCAVGGSGSPSEDAEPRVLRACQLLATGAVPAAAQEMGRALELVRPELLRLPFVDAPPLARRLLRGHPRLQSQAAWLTPSSAAPAGGRPGAGEDPAEAAPPPPQALSDREQEVLRHLAEMLSTPEIAAAMFISVNTVRTHIRSILRKLGVSRRNQAVRRAREHGLLPGPR